MPAPSVHETKPLIVRLLISYIHSLCHIGLGPISLWTLSRACPPQKVTPPSSWWWTYFLKWCISSLCLSYPRPKKRSRSCCIMCFVSMVSSEMWCWTSCGTVLAGVLLSPGSHCQPLLGASPTNHRTNREAEPGTRDRSALPGFPEPQHLEQTINLGSHKAVERPSFSWKIIVLKVQRDTGQGSEPEICSKKNSLLRCLDVEIMLECEEDHQDQDQSHADSLAVENLTKLHESIFQAVFYLIQWLQELI